MTHFTSVLKSGVGKNKKPPGVSRWFAFSGRKDLVEMEFAAGPGKDGFGNSILCGREVAVGR